MSDRPTFFRTLGDIAGLLLLAVVLSAMLLWDFAVSLWSTVLAGKNATQQTGGEL